MNRKIEQSIHRDRTVMRQELKLLLLGTGECGKSTVVKQMKIIHGQGYSADERRSFIPLIYQNIIDSMSSLIRAMQQLKIDFQNPDLEPLAVAFLASADEIDEPPFDDIKRFWDDSGLQVAYSRRREYQLPDSTKYYLDDLYRVVGPLYLPTDQDILRSRIPTTGIAEYNFEMSKINFRMVDVGGQRSQRRKWIHCFEDVTSLIFIVAVSEYDQVLLESATTNRMVESLSLFRAICRERWFRNASVILFLNKTDILQEKLQHSKVSDYFPAYTGDNKNLEQVKQFFLDMFTVEKTHIYPHFTCATDTSNIKFVFEAVQSTILQDHLTEYNLS